MRASPHSRPKQAAIRGYVLAGGGSTRFGQDKALIEIAGSPMLLRMRTLVAAVATEVQIIAPSDRYASLGLTGIPDRWEGQGPLAGIITALLTTRENSAAEWNVIVGCDMPFLTSEWLTYLAQRAQASAADVLAPNSAHGLEPLCACWRTSVAPVLQQAFERGVRKITEAMRMASLEVVDESDWKRFDSAERLFWNMNTAADYQEARRILQAESA